MNGSNTDKPVQLDIFYNTTHLTDRDVKLRKSIISYQNRQIMNFFKDNPAGYFTPFEVKLFANLERTPITSIRRALNTLTTAGLIIKTDHMRPGDYGAVNHTWKLA